MMATEMDEHPWAKNFSNEIGPKIRKGLKDAARLLAFQVALKKADELINEFLNTKVVIGISKRSQKELTSKRDKWYKARDRAMSYLEDK